MTDMTVSQTILRQLGGNRLAVMTGAKAFIGSTDALSFRIPGNMTKNRANVVRITYDASLDAYFLTFMRHRGTRFLTVGQFNSLHADQLAEVFTRETGLDTRL